MRGALHVLATVVLLPYVALAAAFLLLGNVIAGGSLLSMLGRLLAHATWIIPWGIIGAACAIVAIALLGIIPGYHRLGGLVLGVLAVSSLLAIVFMTGRPAMDASQLLFLSPCVAVLGFGAWLWFAGR